MSIRSRTQPTAGRLAPYSYPSEQAPAPDWCRVCAPAHLLDKIGPAIEGLFADGRYRGVDGDGGETGAATEGVVADGRHRGGDDDGGQTGAATKGIVADGRHRAGDGDGGETSAFIEGIDGRHRGGDGDVCRVFPYL